MALEIFLPPDYYAAQLFFTGTGVPSGAAVTFGGYATFVGSTPIPIANLIATAWATHMDADLSQAITLSKIRVKKGPMEDGPFGELSVANTGASIGLCSPSNVSFLIKKVTAVGGKKGAGRMFLPGVRESDVDEGGAVLAAKVTSLQASLNSFLGRLATDAIHMHLLHSYGNYINKKGETIVLAQRNPDEVTNLVLDPRVATQRRRLRR